MGFAEIALINTAIHDTLKLADDELAKYSQNFDQIEEGMLNTPALQTYWVNSNTGDATDRATFRGGMRIQDYLFNVDLYLDQRAFSDTVYTQMFDLFDKIEQVFLAQNTKPYFGLVDDNDNPIIKSFHVRTERATFEYEGNDGTVSLYPGVRFSLDIRVF